MKIKLIKINDEYSLLYKNSIVQNINKMMLSDFLRNFDIFEKLYFSDEQINRRALFYSEAESYDYETIAHIKENKLTIINFDPFNFLFEQKNLTIDDFISTEEYAKKVKKSVEQINVHLRNRRIPNAKKIGRDWVIAKDSIYKYPIDRRYK